MSTTEPSDKQSPWSISVKTFGAEVLESGKTASRERDFVVEVSPDDDLRALYDKIENATGLKASQQRLIYRGRLVEGVDEQRSEAAVDSAGANTAKVDKEPKIKDIVGLENGHTIHLVPKREDRNKENPAGNTGSSAASSSENENNETIRNGSSSLLTSLLGTSSGTEGVSSAGYQAGRMARSSRIGPQRRAHYRLSSEDLEVPDPGSMEAIRQGLLTMHTMLPPARLNFSTEPQIQSPLDVNRRWYIGQWIDCRDTVNHWLEATISDIVLPDDILPPREISSTRRKRERASLINPVNDPVVAGTDIEGRLRLLLEPCLEGDSDDEGGELVGFRRRDNTGVQLLLVHYNGWPHRWDEWIRSDSERIRPFRVRTRHPASSSTALPTPQSRFADSPQTFIRSSDESFDRRALLPELSQIMDSVNSLLSSASHSIQRSGQETSQRENGEDPRLPWTTPSAEDPVSGRPGEVSENPVEAVVPEAGQQLTRRQLEALAPLLDRLGRTLVDAAPHVASLAASMTAEEASPGESSSGLSSIEERNSTLGGFFSLLNRDRRRSGASSEEATVVSEEDSGRSPAVASRRRLSSTGIGSSPSVASTGVNSIAPNEMQGASTQEPCPPVHIDPDFVDFATGVVNTTRGEVRSGPRGRRGQSDEFAGLLGAYLAAASLAGAIGDSDDADGNDNLTGLARLLRDRGTGTGGIDIHIHAVVTAPSGMGAGTVGTIGGGGLNLLSPVGGITATNINETAPGTPNDNLTSTFGSLFSSSRRQSPSASQSAVPTFQRNDDDLGIFEELYSETPEPINPSSISSTEAMMSPMGDSTVSRWEGSDASNRASMGLHENSSRQVPRPRNDSSDAGQSDNNDERRRRSLLSRILFRRSTGR